MGTKAFVEMCNKLAKKYGNRFKPNKLLREMAASGDSFYHRFLSEKRKAA
jgi:3-hydroxyacyl-CoA dehydrogenase/enoyl-CoA hydratase/3-hydroxybutyryl-CoA epimerase